MKKFSKFMMTMFAIASIGAFASCEKVELVDDGNGPITGSIEGQWTIKKAYYNNSVMAADAISLSISFNADGTGEIRNFGFELPYEESHFHWTLSDGDDHTLTITLYNEEVLTYTVIKLTDTEFNITGTVVPTTTLEGDVTIFFTRPGGGSDPEPGDPDAFPGNTNWGNNYSTTVDYDETTLDVNVASTLKFNRTGSKGSLNVVGTVAQMPVPFTYSLNFTYVFNADNNTGTMTFSVDGAEDANIDFTYDSTANTITFSTEGLVIPEQYAAYVNMPETLVFNRL